MKKLTQIKAKSTALLLTLLCCLCSTQMWGQTYKLATSTDELDAAISNNQKCLIVCTSFNKALGPASSNKTNRTAIDVTITTDNTIKDKGNIVALTLGGDATNGYTFYDETTNGYLYASSSNSNQLKSDKTTVDNDAKASITFSSNDATITFQGQYTHNLIRYNSNSELFSCYVSGQKAVQIFLEEKVDESTCQKPDFSVSEGTYYTTQSVTLSSTTDGASIYYTTDGTEPTTSSTLYEEGTAITVDKSMTIKAIAVKEGWSNSEVTSATYKILTNLTEVTFDFTKIDGFDDWSNTYSQHIIEYPEATVTFDNANRSTSTSTGAITDRPVFNKAGAAVTVVLKDKDAEFATISAEFKQWGTKTQTITLNTSTDGTNYDATTPQSSTFSISETILEGGVKAVKFTFSNTSNQVGITSITIKVAGLKKFTCYNEEGYATYYCESAYTMPQGLTGGIITAADNENLTIDYKYNAGETVPAGSALLIKGCTKGTTYIATPTDSEATADANNLLHGAANVDADGNVSVAPATAGNTMRYYVLSYDADGKNIGFYYRTADGAAFPYEAGKAYLAIETEPGAASAPSFLFDSISTGIAAAQTANKAQSIYTISGVKMNANTKLPAGLYIVNGKKVIVK